MNGNNIEIFAHAMVALNAGKDVLIEKPMCMTYEEAKILYEIHMNPEKPAIYTRFNRRDDWQMLLEYGGGNLFNWGPHLVDQALILLDSPVKAVWSNLQHTIGGGDAEDHVEAILTGENNRTLKIEISNDHAFPTPDYEIFGSRGAAVYRDKKLYLKYINPEQILEKAVADAETPGQHFGKTGTFAAKEEIQWVTEEIACAPGDLTIIWNGHATVTFCPHT